MEKLNFIPSEGYIVLAVEEVKEVTEAGIIKPESLIKEETNKKKDDFLTVAACSLTCNLIGNYKIGDKVLVAQGRHPLLIINNKTYIVVNESLILGKMI